MVKLKTGYFAYKKRYEELGYICISIARVKPKWFDGSCIYELAPTYDMLDRFKHGTLRGESYREEYYHMIEDLDFETLFKSLEDLVSTKNAKGIVFLCYERSDDPCHRHFLADYLNDNYNLGVDELSVK